MNHHPSFDESPSGDDRDFKPRRNARLVVEDRTGLRGGNLYEVHVKNVSASGFSAECPSRLEIGSYVVLDVPGIGPVRAQVRWQLGPRIGGMFLDPISLVRCQWTGVKQLDGTNEGERR